MKPMMLIPILAVSLVAASASLTPASACAPRPGQCCTSPVFRENGKYCQLTQCLGTSGGGLTRDKNCWFTDQPINENPVPPVRPRTPSGGWTVHTVPGSSGTTHQ
jgi:hypothetical protein